MLITQYTLQMQRYKLFLIQARKRDENDIVSYSENEFSKNSSLITRSAVSYCSIGAYSVDSPYTTRHHTHHLIRCILLRM